MTTQSKVFFSGLALLVAMLVGLAPPAAAQDKFDKPVRILVGFPAGGTADLIARVVADKLKDASVCPSSSITAPVRSGASPPRP